MLDPCADLTRTVNPGCGKLLIVRSSKDAMPFRQGSVLSTYMMDYIPPYLMPNYSGGFNTVASCATNTFGGASKKYLQQERSDILGSRIRRKFLYGRLPCDYSPFTDVAAAGKAIRWQRLKEAGSIIPSNADAARRKEINMLHQRCVDFREFYLDKTNKMHPDPFFDVGIPYPVRCPVDERVFKIKRFEDKCNVSGHLGPPLRCNAMPCLKDRGILKPFVLPRLPRSPFQCDAVKPRDPTEHKVLLV